jgi:hypothetical protein
VQNIGAHEPIATIFFFTQHQQLFRQIHIYWQELTWHEYTYVGDGYFFCVKSLLFEDNYGEIKSAEWCAKKKT